MNILLSFVVPFLFLSFPTFGAKKIPELCAQVQKKLDRFSMGKVPCDSVEWEFARHSRNGYPLISKRFGNKPEEVMLLVCGVHGDEHSSPYFCFRLAQELSEMQKTKPDEVPNIAIAPLVNPDGFYAGTRPNIRGIDLNRNFPTKDFKEASLREWKKLGSPKRKYPGKALEPETVFQMKLIEVYKPKKIVSIHSPLNFIDYDGPSAKWAIEVAGQHQNLPFKNYQTFVGSLGRWAGEELHIPTFTLELEHSSFKKEELDGVYNQFQSWMLTMIKTKPEINEVAPKELLELTGSEQATPSEPGH